MKSFITNSKEETIALAEKLAKKLNNHDIIFYIGGLGMGKTAFTQGLCNGLGIDTDVTSPTFAIVNEYYGRPLSLFHFDMYRIENEDQLFNIGFDDYLDYDGVLAIEWSENIADFFSENNITVTFEKLDETVRKITIEGVDCNW
ncbi:MAG: tRNA (adenosine(37)-N6)-threonylcarbamoyltransferase complex ATPase subunit type 1 TsaE [Oscillospiraceae bacterium]|nr:tRNA (adenosine(37)-N6)-threonylcarbamoyltransferase complex ATPase subunit type 1 TsaE [Oscillospiraceae bacterium]